MRQGGQGKCSAGQGSRGHVDGLTPDDCSVQLMLLVWVSADEKEIGVKSDGNGPNAAQPEIREGKKPRRVIKRAQRSALPLPDKPKRSQHAPCNARGRGGENVRGNVHRLVHGAREVQKGGPLRCTAASQRLCPLRPAEGRERGRGATFSPRVTDCTWPTASALSDRPGG